MRKIESIMLLIAVLILLATANKPPAQTIVPNLLDEGCFEKDDCWRPITEGYCGVRYDCVLGKCWSEDILCPEDCGVRGDEDMDGLSDCNDPDCWNTPYCHCSVADYSACKKNRCYCPDGQTPKWFVTDQGNYCSCVS